MTPESIPASHLQHLDQEARSDGHPTEAIEMARDAYRQLLEMKGLADTAELPIVTPAVIEAAHQNGTRQTPGSLPERDDQAVHRR